MKGKETERNSWKAEGGSEIKDGMKMRIYQ